jgi:hypothetical protein
MRKLALVVMCLVGCGGSSSVPIDGLQQEFLNSYCDILVRCGLVDNALLCQSLYLGLTIDKDTLAAVQAGKIIYHGDKAQQCLDSLSGSSCARNDFLSSRSQSTACDETFEGTVGDMGACALNDECISRDCAIPSCPANTCCQGMCVGGTAPVRPKLGEACTNTSSSTRCTDSYCDAMTAKCTAYKPAGTSCLATSECVIGAACTNSVCTMLVATGGACTSSSNCSDIGDTCVSMICTAVGLAGAACTTSSDCSGIYICDGTRHCALKPRLGETCTGGSSSCIDHSYCDATTMKCTAPQADGATCAQNRECSSNNCDATSKCSTPAVCI